MRHLRWQLPKHRCNKVIEEWVIKMYLLSHMQRKIHLKWQMQPYSANDLTILLFTSAMNIHHHERIYGSFPENLFLLWKLESIFRLILHTVDKKFGKEEMSWKLWIEKNKKIRFPKLSAVISEKSRIYAMHIMMIAF